jgi:hypothetical protein
MIATNPKPPLWQRIARAILAKITTPKGRATLLLVLLGAGRSDAQTFGVVWDPNPDPVDGYRVHVDGSEVGSTTLPSWAVTPSDAAIHRVTMTAFHFLIDAATGTLLDTLVSTPSAPVYLQAGCRSDQIVGEYFAGLDPSTAPKVARVCLDAVDFSWGPGGPFPELTDQFSARFTIPLTLSTAGTAHCALTADDGVQLAVDGQTVLDHWIDQAATAYSVDVPLGAGTHTAVVRWYENTWDAVIRASCVVASTPPPPPPPPPTDTVAPLITSLRVSFTKPNKFTATVMASDETKLASATITVGATALPICTTTAVSLQCSRSFTLGRGTYPVTATAKDAEGNVSLPWVTSVTR